MDGYEEEVKVFEDKISVEQVELCVLTMRSYREQSYSLIYVSLRNVEDLTSEDNLV